MMGLCYYFFFWTKCEVIFGDERWRPQKNCGSEQMKGHQIVHGPVLCPCFAYNKI